MKKFWNLMLAALVIIGATACTENYEGVDVAESLSFYAEIGDDTRATIDKVGNEWKTSFEGGEILMVNGYKFTNTKEEPGKFTCTAVGVSKLAGAEVTITTDGTHHSLQGKKAFNATATVKNFGAETVKLTSPTSFFRYTYNGTNNVKFTLSADVFKSDANTAATEITVNGVKGENFIAFWPTDEEVTLSYTINDVVCKSVKKEFKPGMVYNLGTLAEPSDWEISDGTRFFTTETTDLFVAKNVKLSDNKFCLHKVGDTAWGAGAKYGLVTAGTKSENTAIGLYSCNWAGDITISNATTTAHDFYFDRANSRLYVMTVGKTPDTVTAPTNSNKYNVTGSKYGWGACNAAHQFVYSGDNVWHLVVAFAANEQFKVQLNNGWDTSYGYGGIQSTVGQNLFNSSNDGNAIAKNAGTYEIWVIPSHGSVPLYIIKR